MNTKQKPIAVVGGGVIGTTTAYSLLRRGQKVLLIDENPGVALRTSYANAGELSFGYSGPWATPGLLPKLPAMLLSPDSPLQIHPDTSSFENLCYQAKWMYWMALNTKESQFQRNKRRILELSTLSKRMFHQHFGEFVEDFAWQQGGTLQLFRTGRKFDMVCANDAALLSASGVRFSLVDREGCIAQEPALVEITDQIAGGIVFHEDETGDCHLFTQRLASRFVEAGGEILFSTRVNGIDVDRSGVRGLDTNRGYIATDHVVLACGPYTRTLTSPLGMYVPIYPVRGYSMTAEIVDASRAPQSTVLDEDTKVALTRLGSRLRVGGTAEISGFSRPDDLRRRALLSDVADAIFPGCFDDSHGSGKTNWSGFRPMTPDGTPIIGRTACRGLFINAGHGTLGWTQSAGSAEQIAALVCEEMPPLIASEYELARYGHKAQLYSYYLPFPPLANPC